MSNQRCLAIGIDVGGSFLKSGFVSREGEIVFRDRRAIQKETREEFYEQLGELARYLVKSAGGAEVVGIGIGVAGFINWKTGRIEKSPNLPILDGAPIFADLGRVLPLPSIIDNDANAAAWGEYWAGGGSDAQLLILLTLGSGVGGGIVWKGGVWRGAIGYGGEIGHTVITPDGPLCNCGMRGCIEAEFSQTAFERKAREAIAAGRKTSLAAIKDRRIFAKDVTDAAAAGDALALEIVGTSSRLLGMVIGNLIDTLNPDQMVLGGGIIAAADLLLPLILRGVEERSIPGARAACRIRPSVLGNDAGLIGAAGLAWEEAGE
jgi:glucokinase